MKKLITVTILLCVKAGLSQGINGYRHGKEIYSIANGTSFNLYDSSLFSYTAGGLLEHSLSFNSFGDSVGKSTSTYDSYGNIVDYLYLQMSGITWVNRQNIQYFYEVNNQFIQALTLYWNSTSSSWDSTFKTDYIYNSSNQLIQSIHYNYSSAWSPDTRNDNSFDINGILDTVTVYTFNGIWIPQRQTAYTFYQIAPGQTPDFGQTGTYNSGSRKTHWKTYYMKYWSGSAWVNSWKDTIDFDIHDNPIAESTYQWNNTNSTWDTYSDYKYLLSYDANFNITQEIEQERHTPSTTFNNNWKREYLDYQQYVGLPEINDEETEIYPNPSQGQITVKLSSPYMKGEISIMNLQGQVLESFSVNELVSIIDFCRYASGVYFVQFQSNTYHFQKRIIIEK